jgi:hypothetical protein
MKHSEQHLNRLQKARSAPIGFARFRANEDNNQ